MGLSLTHLKYLRQLLLHKLCVAVAGRGTVPLWRLLIHDWSKFTPAEFGPYARRYHGGRSGDTDHSRDPDEWHKAWMHHWHRNPHHWEHWLKIEDSKLTPLPMPLTYIYEMIADWKGASRVYTGSWNISKWYMRNHTRMLLHPETRAIVEDLLFETFEFPTPPAVTLSE